jgi:hypothetical protein
MNGWGGGGGGGVTWTQVFLLHACSTSRSHFKVLKKVLLAVVGVGFILCCLLLAFLWEGICKYKIFANTKLFFDKLFSKSRASKDLISRAFYSNKWI